MTPAALIEKKNERLISNSPQVIEVNKEEYGEEYSNHVIEQK